MGEKKTSSYSFPYSWIILFSKAIEIDNISETIDLLTTGFPL